MKVPASPSGASVLELLHPLGYAGSVRVIGRGCHPEFSLCPQSISLTPGHADLIILAPSLEELATSSWLEEAVQDSNASLSRDGVLYVLSHRSRRRQMQALLSACGLRVASVLYHHPNWREAGTLIPLEPRPLAYAFSRLIRTNPVRRRVALALIRVPGALEVVRALVPYVGLVVQRHGAQPPSKWLTGLVDAESQVSGVVLNTSWRGRAGAVLLHAVDDRQGEAVAIAKTWLSARGENAVAREANGLEEVAARAGDYGVRVPRLLGRGSLGDQPYMAETAVIGEKAAILLHGNPQLLGELLTRLADWLLGWNSATAQPQVLTQDLLGRSLLQPAAELLPLLGAGEGYPRNLRALADRLLGQRMPFVATHGDLTMVNVLMDREKHLGVIDWETASRSELPLADFYYAAVDAATAVANYQDRPAAYAACFAPDGRYRALVAQLEARFVDKLGLTMDQVALSYHASWLKYALAERRETAKTAPDEFLEIARQAALVDYGHEREHGTRQ
jgi:hypothetical protein